MNVLNNRFAKLSRLFFFVAAIAFTSSAFGTLIIGDLNPGSPADTQIDGYTGGVYADATQTFGIGGQAASVTFNGNSVGRSLTFMVGTYSAGQFTPTGIFNPITTTGTLQTVNLLTLGLASGSGNVTAGETFGWTDQHIGVGNNGGSIYYADGSGTYQYFRADASQNETVVVGTPVGDLATFGIRDYSVNMAINQVPEPSTFVLAGLGALGLFLAARRRRA